MPLSVAVHTLLQEKLGDALYPEKLDGKDVKLLDVIAGTGGWFDKAEAAAKIQTANSEISRERDELRDAKKQLGDQIAALQKDIDAAKSQGKKVPEEVQAEMNKLKANVDDLTKQLGNMTTQVQQERQAARDARLTAENESVKKELLEKFSSVKILDKNARLAVNNLFAENMVKIVQKEDGSVERQYRIFKDNQPLAASLDEIVSHVAKENPSLVSGGDPRGSGTPPGGGGGGGQTKSFSAMMHG